MRSLTTTQLVDELKRLTGDTFGNEDAEALLGAAYDDILLERPWYFLRKWWSSATFAAAGVTLPTDWLSPYEDKLYVGSSAAGAEKWTFYLIPFEQWIERKDSDGYWWVDHASSMVKFTGTPSATGTIYLPYCYSPDPLTVAANNTPVLPPGTHLLIAYGAAQLWYVKEQAERGSFVGLEEIRANQRMLHDKLILLDAEYKELEMRQQAIR
ncbi:MAG: hypothetical protein PHI63_04770 [Patescibacteria group bacterium]|nr:hypothetical protein [Patescibacteria group bacterium]